MAAAAAKIATVRVNASLGGRISAATVRSEPLADLGAFERLVVEW